jgi:hypothetical protein
VGDTQEQPRNPIICRNGYCSPFDRLVLVVRTAAAKDSSVGAESNGQTNQETICIPESLECGRLIVDLLPGTYPLDSLGVGSPRRWLWVHYHGHLQAFAVLEDHPRILVNEAADCSAAFFLEIRIRELFANAPDTSPVSNAQKGTLHAIDWGGFLIQPEIKALIVQRLRPIDQILHLPEPGHIMANNLLPEPGIGGCLVN